MIDSLSIAVHAFVNRESTNKSGENEESDAKKTKYNRKAEWMKSMKKRIEGGAEVDIHLNPLAGTSNKVINWKTLDPHPSMID